MTENVSSSIGAIPNTESWHVLRRRGRKIKLFFIIILFCCVFLFIFLLQNVVRWLTARAKWLENTLMLFRGCEETVPFTGLILRCLLVRQWQNSPRVHSRVTSLQKRKWEENKLPRQRRGGRWGAEKSTYSHFSLCNSKPGRQKRHRCIHIYYPDRKCWNEVK